MTVPNAHMASADSFDERHVGQQLFERLAELTGDGVGITRASYGNGESLALDAVETVARELGLATDRDHGANLVVTLPGSEPELPYIACGSHLDSVPQGGNFDGAAGVVAGLLVLGRLKAEGFVPRRSIKLFGLRGEESARFGKAYIGSRALFGELTEVDLSAKSSDTQRSLGDCMRDVGADVERIRRGERLLDASRIFVWLELHIEQGPVLIARGQSIGIVTGIRGNIRHRAIECVGEAGHSGAIPRWLRHDAVFATAELMTRIDHHWRTLLECGRDLVVTSGLFGTVPEEHAIARIPGHVRFSFEARSQSHDTLEEFYNLFLSECASICEERGVAFDFDRRVDSGPAIMDRKWIERLGNAAKSLGIPAEEMPSGAGHDAAVFATAGVPSAMIFVRNRNGSHNPEEDMDLADFLEGVAVLREAITESAQ